MINLLLRVFIGYFVGNITALIYYFVKNRNKKEK